MNAQYSTLNIERSTQPPPTIYLVDDDPSVRRSLDRVLRAAGYQVRCFESASAYLASGAAGPGCLVLDVRLPGLDGFALQKKLAAREYCLPIIFITGHGDIPMTVRAMKAGAADFLPKPFRAKALLDAVGRAVKEDAQASASASEMQELRDRVKALSARENEVFQLVVTGMLNKQIAATLKITERTVKAHRHSVMKKLGVVGPAQLVHIADRLNVPQSRGKAS